MKPFGRIAITGAFLLVLTACDALHLPSRQRTKIFRRNLVPQLDRSTPLTVATEAGEQATQTKLRLNVALLEEKIQDNQDLAFMAVALTPAIIAFATWSDVSQFVSYVTDVYGFTGRNVDGNAFASNLLRPTINGVVVPVISISLGTLVSTTVNVLRDRQVEMRALINKEVCELRLLRRAVFGMFGTRQHARRRIQALELMRGYTEQLESESTVGGVDGLNDLQLRGGIAVNELDSMAEMLHGIDGAAASRQGSVGVAETLIVSLNGHRSNRVALLLSGFPAIHWVILGGLSASVCVAFLLVSDQEVLQYLNSVQLRALFSILVGVLSGTAALCFDLADPFRGSFCISSAASQLGDLKVALQQDLAEAGAEAPDTGSLGSQFKTWAQKKELDMDTTRRIRDQGRSQLTQTAPQGSDVNISTNALAVVEDTANSSTGHVLPPLLLTQDSPRSRSRYGLASTLYFHLLTGPLGFNVRALGDLFAWVVSFVSQHSRGVVAWCHRSGSFLTRKPPGKRRGTGTSPPLAGA